MGSAVGFLLFLVTSLSGKKKTCVQMLTGVGDSSLVYFTSEMTFKIPVLKVCLLPTKTASP